ncbi:MAG: DUF3160 domain-containing protein [Sedimentisphaerales bacterium]|nr:DUF3160 domain-containing protein [Sedimentisphaerales bacterium]
MNTYRLTIVFVVILFNSIGVVHADTIYVNGGCGDDTWTGAGSVCTAPDGPKATIQAGITAASPGDTVLVADGTYTGSGNRDIDFLGKAITLSSENGPANCIIDCQAGPGNLHRGFYFHTSEGPDSRVQGFTIKSGKSQMGGAIYCNSAGPTITDCVITTCNAILGGGIYLNNSEILWEGCTISENSADISGGGFYTTNGSLEMNQCTIQANTCTSESGGGLNCNNTSLVLTNSTIAENTASLTDGAGGGLRSENGSVQLNTCTIQGNAAELGGGLYLAGADQQLSHCILSNNSATATGGAIRCNQNNITIDNCTFYNNSAATGGAIASRATSDTVIRNSILWGNSAADGPQIALSMVTDPTLLRVSYSNIEGGQAAVHTEPGCEIEWGLGNLDGDPLFADAPAGDFHLKSEASRWDPNQDTWLYDTLSSPGIDAGNPASELADEYVSIRNVRINLGAYGGTAQASKSPLRWQMLADINNDDQVGIIDLFVLVQNWLVNFDLIPPDFDRNDLVDLTDLGRMSQDWLAESRVADEQTADMDKPGFGQYYTPLTDTIEPNAPGYDLPINMDDVWNYDDVNYYFYLDAVRSTLEDHGFIVLNDFILPCTPECPPDDIREGFTTIYEHLRRMYMYIFITSDTLLHIYHVQFDENLKEIEEDEFIPDIKSLTKVLLAQAKDQYDNYSGDLKEAAKRNVAYLSVANELIDPDSTDPNDEIPPYVVTLVAGELAKIEAHEGFEPSDIFIYFEDYSQYVPRGHYTRSEDLKKYFKTLMWYGRISFLLKGADIWGRWEEALISIYDAKIQTCQAVLLADSIHSVQVAERTGQQIWQRIYDITAFYVGLADDLTPYEYIDVVNELFGSDFVVQDLEEEDNYFEFKAKLGLLRSPLIFGGTGNAGVNFAFDPNSLNDILEKTKGMRFMGQRFIPDSYMFQHLVYPEVLYYLGGGSPFTLAPTGDGGIARCYPRGLDVMAILGSQEAENILIQEGDTEYLKYDEKYTMLQDIFEAFDPNDWNQNLYWSWLYSLQSLLVEFEEGYPNYMRTNAWERKELNAALASWTELRHDTILYAKQSYTPSGKGGVNPPPNATGYVEPVPEFYRRLWALSNMTQQGLNDLDALSPESYDRIESFKTILIRLIEISEKELLNQDLSAEDFEFIGDFAEVLEETITGIDNQGISSVLVADVHTHTYEEKVVEEGVGFVDLIAITVQLSNGSNILALGPVMSYYEFKHPMDDRLTDEAWRDILESYSPPDPLNYRPPWYLPYLYSH